MNLKDKSEDWLLDQLWKHNFESYECQNELDRRNERCLDKAIIILFIFTFVSLILLSILI